MAFARRNAGWITVAALLGGVGLVGASWIAWRWLPARPAMLAALPPQSYTPLDEMSFGEVQQLRRDLHLDDDALGCMNLTATQLETLVAGLRNWYETNAADLRARRAALADQRALVRHHESEIKMGRGDVASLTDARGQLAVLEAAHASYLAGVETQVLASLSDAQRTQFDIAKANATMPMPLRALNLTAGQADAVRAARARYFRSIGVQRDPELLAAIKADYEQAVANAVGAANAQQLDTLRGILGPASVRVVSALNLVLPEEDEQ